MMMASNAPARCASYCLGGLAAAATMPARAALPTIDESEGAPGLFSFGYMGAYDYILLAVALLVGIATGYFYYRSNLFEAVDRMQRPGKVKLRAIGLGLAAFALILMLSPSLPIGVLLILAAVGLVIALISGVGMLATAAIVLIAIVMFGLWYTGTLGSMFG